METDRRDFLKAGAVAAAGLLRPDRVLGANDRVRVAVIGLRGRGFDHLRTYRTIPGVEIAAVCDVDENVMATRLRDLEKLEIRPAKTYVDYRKLLEDKSIDAVSIATPNHWHSLMAIWACQAGKDVYVEKPLSHTWFEGKQLVAAAAKYNRIVQHGTQCRSGIGVNEAVEQLRKGLVGDVYLARGLCYKWRNTIGRQAVEPVPAGVNYDLWLGPAPDRGFTRNRFHYNWHWFWDTGNGDVGNQGIHEMDAARWGLGVKFPTKVSAMGGHMMFADDQETPNLLSCNFQFDGSDGKRRMLQFEVRHWITNNEAEIGKFGQSSIPAAGLRVDAKPAKKDTINPPAGRVNTIGNIYYGSKGYLAIQDYDTYRTWLGETEEPGPSGHGGERHFANFIDCVRSRKKEDLGAPVEEGHISCTMVHLANVSYRLGRTLNFDPATEQVTGDDEANRLLRNADRGYRRGFEIPEKV